MKPSEAIQQLRRRLNYLNIKIKLLEEETHKKLGWDRKEEQAIILAIEALETVRGKKYGTTN
jgi:hypothetical protein